MKQAVAESVAKDKDFLEKVLKLDSVDEVKRAFKEKGVDISAEDIEIIGEMVRSYVENDTNISNEVLEKTVGGWSDPNFKKFKNISVGLSALALAMAALCVTHSVNDSMKSIKKTWIGKGPGSIFGF
jgi:hypothetical protein